VKSNTVVTLSIESATRSYADEKLTAFLELESAIHRRSFCIDRQPKFSADSTSLNGSESRGGHSR
jgi:hypothetical protein